jgi:hypothetical protein
MEVLAAHCRNGTCPTIYQGKPGMVVVQGYVVTDAPVELGPGEALVEIPAELLLQAINHA